MTHSPCLRRAAFALLLALALPGAGAARTIYVNGSSQAMPEDGSLARPYRNIGPAVIQAVDGDVIMVQAGAYHEIVSITRIVQLQPNPAPVTIGQFPWGRLANPGWEARPIKSTLFFAGEPLDGTGSTDSTSAYYNQCGPSADGMWCYARQPYDKQHLHWIDPLDVWSTGNRNFAVQAVANAGFNVLSMSSWGEQGLPCTIPCPDPAVCAQQTRCHPGPGGQTVCNIGWFGAANMQMTTYSKDQLFDATLGMPLLVMPFIESRFGLDWDFHDDFPYSTGGQLAPGLVSQVEELVRHYLVSPANAQWPAKWTQVYDQFGQARYAITIVQAASATIDPADPLADQTFAAGFDAVAQRVLQDTGKLVGFFIDPIARNPTSSYGCPGIDPSWVFSNYGPDPPPAPQREWFKPDPITTGPWLRKQASILGIQSFSPEGWMDAHLGTGHAVTECFKLAWKRDYSAKWFATGIPFLQDVSPGYDGLKLFANRQPPGGLTQWGYDPAWRQGMTQLVHDYGQMGFVYNAWNGYCEGLVGMRTDEESGELPPWPTYTWMTTLTAAYP